MPVKLSTGYVEGVLVPVLSAKVESLHELKLFTSFTDYDLVMGLKNKRVSIPVHLLENPDFTEFLATAEFSNFSSVYNHYLLDLQKCAEPKQESQHKDRIEIYPNVNIFADQSYSPSSTIPTGTDQVKYKVRYMMTKLMKECAERMSSEFNQEGVDPSWYFLVRPSWL